MYGQDMESPVLFMERSFRLVVFNGLLHGDQNQNLHSTFVHV